MHAPCWEGQACKPACRWPTGQLGRRCTRSTPHFTCRTGSSELSILVAHNGLTIDLLTQRGPLAGAAAPVAPPPHHHHPAPPRSAPHLATRFRRILHAAIAKGMSKPSDCVTAAAGRCLRSRLLRAAAQQRQPSRAGNTVILLAASMTRAAFTLGCTAGGLLQHRRVYVGLGLLCG